MIYKTLDTARPIRVIADVHGNLDDFKRIVEDAVSKGLYILSVGDLEDRGPAPAECLKIMMDLIDTDDGAMILSNHFWKHYRYHSGNPVNLNEEHQKTVDDFERLGIVDRYMETFKDIPWFATLGNFFFAHAAYHPVTMDETASNKAKKAAKARLMYGQTDGTYTEKGFPRRLLDWLDEVPDNMSVVVGHHVLSTEKILKFQTQGGPTYFLDLGSGKDGPLAYMDIVDDVIVNASHKIVPAAPSDYGAYNG